jgi:hypothetical protein
VDIQMGLKQRKDDQKIIKSRWSRKEVEGCNNIVVVLANVSSHFYFCILFLIESINPKFSRLSPRVALKLRADQTLSNIHAPSIFNVNFDLLSRRKRLAQDGPDVPL